MQLLGPLVAKREAPALSARTLKIGLGNAGFPMPVRMWDDEAFPATLHELGRLGGRGQGLGGKLLGPSELLAVIERHLCMGLWIPHPPVRRVEVGVAIDVE